MLLEIRLIVREVRSTAYIVRQRSGPPVAWVALKMGPIRRHGPVSRQCRRSQARPDPRTPRARRGISESSTNRPLILPFMRVT